MSGKRNAGIGSSLEGTILALVRRRPGITQKEAVQSVEKTKKTSHNTIRKQLKKMVRDGTVCERRRRGGRGIEYFAPDYVDKNIEELMRANFESLGIMLRNIEEESKAYSHQLKLQVNGHIEHLLYSIPESIEEWKSHFAIQCLSQERSIHEETKDMRKLLDEGLQKKDLSQKQYWTLSRVIGRIKTELCKIDRRSVKFAVQRQKARTADSRKAIEGKIRSVDDDWNRHHSELDRLESRIRTKNLDDAYVEGLVGTYLRNEPDMVQKTRALLNERNPRASHKLEEPLLKIWDAWNSSIQEQNSLLSKLEEETDRDVCDDIKGRLRGEQDKTKECEDLIGTIHRHLESGTSINGILAEIPEEYTETG